jgi:PIN domain nuclease of toxin-antitoxin system
VKLLLDTHVWLWALMDPERLGAKAQRLLESTNNELWLSSISVWEAAMLIERKRVRVTGTVESWLSDAMQTLPVNEAPLTSSVAVASRRIKVTHEDPADRFIAATAEVFDLTLLTADERLLAGHGFKHLACR